MSEWSTWAHACKVNPGDRLSLDHDVDPAAIPEGAAAKDAPALLEKAVDELFDLQDRFYAEASRSLLVVLQATDAAGKDGTIKHVMSGLNPQGVEVSSFKAPSTAERSHDFLWRHQLCLPSLGKIAIFNRSHYENVLITRVHPEMIWPDAARDVKPATLWEQRYRAINAWERHLTEEGTVIVKIFLNLSKDEQERRFLARIDNAEKNWKFSSADLKERVYWSQYREAFEEMINHTGTHEAPWYVVPADHKWSSHLFTSAILLHALKDLNPEYPVLDDAERAALQQAKVDILAASDKAKE